MESLMIIVEVLGASAVAAFLIFYFVLKKKVQNKNRQQ